MKGDETMMWKKVMGKATGWLFFVVGAGFILLLPVQTILGNFVFSYLIIVRTIVGIVLLWQGWHLAHPRLQRW